MKVKKLREILNQVDDDYDIDIGKVMVINEETKDPFQLQLDLPLGGIVENIEARSIHFLVKVRSQSDMPYLLEFGTVKKLGDFEKIPC